VHGGVFVWGGSSVAGYNQEAKGFMFRADAGLTYRTGKYGDVSIGLSWVTFPGGQVCCTQPYLIKSSQFIKAVKKV
jgi:hypothetical protein